MPMVPWFAWIAIVAIIVWGVVMVVGTLTGRDLPGGSSSANAEIDKLKKRVKQLEANAGSKALESGQTGSDETRADLEARLERLEIRAEKRDTQAQQHDEWLRQAEELDAKSRGEKPDAR